MADAAGRREARQKRILENAENRMRLITGLSKQADDFNDLPARAQEGSTLFTHSVKKDELKNDLSHHSNSTVTSSLSNHCFESPNDENRSSGFSVGHERSLEEPLLSSTDRQTGATQVIEKSLIYSVLAARLHFVGLALLVRLMFSLNYSFLFGDSIFVPLFTIHLIKFFGLFSNPNNIRGDDGLLFILLKLSGLPARLVGLLTKLMSLMKNFLEDFYVYFFTFIAFHVVLEFLVY